MAALVICATSCTKEDISSTVVGEGEVIEVTFTAGLADLGTRATTGLGAEVNKLYCNVFDAANDNELTELNTTATRGTDGKFTFRVVMVKGMTYDLVLWAECETADFNAYQIDGKEVTVTYNGVANDERYDAFCKFVEGFDPVTDNPAFTLTRPLAQLNAATNDYDAVADSGITLSTSEVTISAFHSFNIATGTASDKSDATFAAAAIPGGDLNTNTGYEYLAVNYLFVSGDSSLVDAKYTFKGTKADTSVVTFTGTDYSAIPLKPNHRTNILGALLTKPADFVVDINADFNPNDEVVNVVTVANAGELQNAINNAPAGENTEIILDGDITLDDLLAGILSTRAGEPQSLVIPAGKVITLNLGGNTLSHEEEQTAAYGMIVNNGDLTITNGTVIYKDTATYTQDPGWASNTVWNNGILTIEEGTTLINDSSASAAEYGYPHVIDNYAKLTINGGTLTNNTDYSSIRIWCTTDDNTEVVINGGTFNGSIDFQTPNASANKGTLTINGGTFNGDNYTKCATRLLGFGADVDEMVATINGGTFNMGISLRNWSGGELNSNVYTIYGGKFVNLANAVQYLAEGAVISPAADLEVSETITIPAGKNFTLDLAGKTVAGTDTTDKSFSVIDNRGALTIDDTVGGGKISLTATINSGWARYSTVVSNNPGGVLTINGGTLEHLGGTDMSYGVDNLTNGKGTSAVTTINGGTIKSSYISIRQFLNGIEATNSLTINGGTLLSSGNKYTIFFQCPSDNINSGDLTIGPNAVLEHNIYLRPSTDVEVSIASAALKNGAEIVYDNQYSSNLALTESNGVWSFISGISFAQFCEALYNNNGVFDQETTVILNDSKRSYQNNKTCQFFVGTNSVSTFPADLDNINVSNVTFMFVDDDTTNNFTSGELQVFTKTMTFTDCTFIGTAVCPWGQTNDILAEAAVINECTFKDLSGRYGVHQNRATELTITGCTFENCERGIHTNSATPVSVTIKNNTFTGIGEGYGMLCLAENGDYTNATLDIAGNNAAGQVCLRQLNTTVSKAQVTAILENNTYGTEYVAGSVIPE